MKQFINNNLFIFKIISLGFGTIIMFIALFFLDKKLSIDTIIEHKSDLMMYLCLLLSFLFSFWINYKLIKMKKSP